jgi:hypothetical protein
VAATRHSVTKGEQLRDSLRVARATRSEFPDAELVLEHADARPAGVHHMAGDRKGRDGTQLFDLHVQRLPPVDPGVSQREELDRRVD